MIAKGRPFGAVCFRCRSKLVRRLPPARYFANEASTKSDDTSAGDDVTHDAASDAIRDAIRDVAHEIRNDAISSDSSSASLPFHRANAPRLDAAYENLLSTDEFPGNETHEDSHPLDDLIGESFVPTSDGPNGASKETSKDASNGGAGGQPVIRRVAGFYYDEQGNKILSDFDFDIKSVKNPLDAPPEERNQRFRRADTGEKLGFGDDATFDGANAPADFNPMIRRVGGFRYDITDGKRPASAQPKPAIPKHWSRGRLLTETAESLDVPILGKRAEAIVMRDGGIVEKRPIKADPDYQPESGPKHFHEQGVIIGALVEQQRERVTQEMYIAGIDELRPTKDKVLLEADFRKLQSRLAQGFLGAQMQTYIGLHRSKVAQEITTNSPPRPEFPWIVEITPWTPLPTGPNPGRAMDPLLQGYISAKMMPKDRLAVRLMRECWGLSIVEVQAQPGETYITLPERDFTLLMRGTRRFINHVGKFWLETGETIEMLEDKMVLRLVTAKQKTESILKDLDGTLRSIRTKTFPLNLVASEVPHDDVLEEIGRITNSYLRVSDSGGRLHVSWIEVQSRINQGFDTLEDVAHIVFRLLLSASKSQQIPSTLIASDSPSEAIGRLLVDPTCKDKLMWKDRLEKWARYVLRVGPEESARSTELPIKAFELPFEPLNEAEKETLKPDYAISEFFPETSFPVQSVKWSDTSRTATVAHFGHILHPYSPSNPQPSVEELVETASRRVFSPMTPHPSQLAKYETMDLAVSPLATSKSTVVLYFTPSPSSNPPKGRPSKKSSAAGLAPKAPPLELRLTVNEEDEIEEIESLRAIKATHTTDVMQPTSLIDVRFTQTQYETVQATDRETLASWQPLADFLGRARLDLGRGKLEMPPRQRFPIPQRLVPQSPQIRRRKATTTTPSSTTISKKDPEAPVSVSYEFVGLELHRSISQSYDDHRLTYTSIEGGQGGGRRAEVTLEPLERNAFDEPVQGGDKLQDFLSCCSRFVADSTLWSGLSNNNTSNKE